MWFFNRFYNRHSCYWVSIETCTCPPWIRHENVCLTSNKADCINESGLPLLMGLVSSFHDTHYCLSSCFLVSLGLLKSPTKWYWKLVPVSLLPSLIFLSFISPFMCARLPFPWRLIVCDSILLIVKLWLTMISLLIALSVYFIMWYVSQSTAHSFCHGRFRFHSALWRCVIVSFCSL